ncbi:UNVERIFIED_CONTAM: hypothetical protein GTU68_034685 [Idotea baltica]|nr:hypothetical protein [Idotea baltica]
MGSEEKIAYNGLVKLIVNALEEVKGKDITVIDVRERTSITDHMVIATGSSNRQVRALAENVLEQSKHVGIQAIGYEGFDTGEWALLDLGDAIIHVMLPETREFYDLERLWQGAEDHRTQHVLLTADD